MKLGKTSGNLVLVTASLFVSLVFVEVLLRLALPLLPLKLHAYITPGLRPLLQPTRRGVLPHDYIALMGDSYSLGMGDELKNANKNRNGYFNPSSYLHDRTGLDVISFGRAGSGNLRGLVQQPVMIFEYVNADPFYSLEKPRHVFYIFYEGNDLDNNITFLEKLYYPSHPDQRDSLDAGSFYEFIGGQAIPLDPDYRKIAGHKPIILLSLDFLSELIKNFNLRSERTDVDDEAERSQHREDDAERLRIRNDGVNRALVGGREVTLHGGLQGPSLELTEEELQTAVSVFEQSLKYSMAYFQNTGYTVLYVPAVISSYSITSPEVSVQRYRGDRQGQYHFPAAAAVERSNRIASDIRAATQRAGAEFIDARPAVREAAALALIHGPIDWKHFNRAGYTVISEAMLASRFFKQP